MLMIPLHLIMSGSALVIDLPGGKWQRFGMLLTITQWGTKSSTTRGGICQTINTSCVHQLGPAISAFLHSTSDVRSHSTYLLNLQRKLIPLSCRSRLTSSTYKSLHHIFYLGSPPICAWWSTKPTPKLLLQHRRVSIYFGAIEHSRVIHLTPLQVSTTSTVRNWCLEDTSNLCVVALLTNPQSHSAHYLHAGSWYLKRKIWGNLSINLIVFVVLVASPAAFLFCDLEVVAFVR